MHAHAMLTDMYKHNSSFWSQSRWNNTSYYLSIQCLMSHIPCLLSALLYPWDFVKKFWVSAKVFRLMWLSSLYEITKENIHVYVHTCKWMYMCVCNDWCMCTRILTRICTKHIVDCLQHISHNSKLSNWLVDEYIKGDLLKARQSYKVCNLILIIQCKLRSLRRTLDEWPWWPFLLL